MGWEDGLSFEEMDGLWGGVRTQCTSAQRLQEDSQGHGGDGVGHNPIHKLQTGGRTGQVTTEASMGEWQQEHC